MSSEIHQSVDECHRLPFISEGQQPANNDSMYWQFFCSINIIPVFFLSFYEPLGLEVVILLQYVTPWDSQPWFMESRVSDPSSVLYIQIQSTVIHGVNSQWSFFSTLHSGTVNRDSWSQQSVILLQYFTLRDSQPLFMESRVSDHSSVLQRQPVPNQWRHESVILFKYATPRGRLYNRKEIIWFVSPFYFCILWSAGPLTFE